VAPVDLLGFPCLPNQCEIDTHRYDACLELTKREVLRAIAPLSAVQTSFSVTRRDKIFPLRWMASPICLLRSALAALAYKPRESLLNHCYWHSNFSTSKICLGSEEIIRIRGLHFQGGARVQVLLLSAYFKITITHRV
jgi:hypothetical protein